MLERMLDDLRQQVEINTIALENLRQEIDRLCQVFQGKIPVIRDALQEIKTNKPKPAPAHLKVEDVNDKCRELMRLDRSHKETIYAMLAEAGAKILPELKPENLQKVNDKVEELLNGAR